ncbi:MAG: aminotransferase class III-fold pyridoxal phosphate-dependent enzyme [Planctomycetales bacterium]
MRPRLHRTPPPPLLPSRLSRPDLRLTLRQRQPRIPTRLRPPPPGRHPIPFNDIAALERELAKGDVAAFIVEPIQGKGSSSPTMPTSPAVQSLCRKHGLFVADEVQTGLGRTGKMFACEHWNLEPDILVIAKALSGGYVPCGAVLSRKAIHDKVFSSLDRCVVHSSTFSQNELGMAAGIATLHVLKEEAIVENAARQGAALTTRLNQTLKQYEMFAEVRGKGLLLGMEFQAPHSTMLKMGWNLLHGLDPSLFCQAMLIPLIKDHRILAQVAGHHLDVIKLIPSLTSTPTSTGW